MLFCMIMKDVNFDFAHVPEDIPAVEVGPGISINGAPIFQESYSEVPV
jgi:hypothetical protein